MQITASDNMCLSAYQTEKKENDRIHLQGLNIAEESAPKSPGFILYTVSMTHETFHKMLCGFFLDDIWA